MRQTSVCESKKCTAAVNGHFCRVAVTFALAYDLPRDFAGFGVLNVLVGSDICRFRAMILS